MTWKLAEIPARHYVTLSNIFYKQSFILTFACRVALPAMSGAPVVNAKAEVVGVHLGCEYATEETVYKVRVSLRLQ